MGNVALLAIKDTLGASDIAMEITERTSIYDRSLDGLYRFFLGDPRSMSERYGRTQFSQFQVFG